MKTKKKSIKSLVNSQKLVDDLRPFGKVIQTTYRGGILLSKPQLTKLSQTSKVMLTSVQKQLDKKLLQQPLNITDLTYVNNQKQMQVMVVLPSGEQFTIPYFIKQLNQLLMGEINENEFYQVQIQQPSKPEKIEHVDNNQHANQVLKQRIRQLTANKVKLTEQNKSLKDELAQLQIEIQQQLAMYQTSQRLVQQLQESNADYQFTIKKQQAEMSTIREKTREKQTKVKQRQSKRVTTESKHVCPKVNDEKLRQKIATLKQEMAVLQRKLHVWQHKQQESSTGSRSERLRQLTGELNEKCLNEYHPLVRLVDKYNQLVSEDLMLWQQVQVRLAKTATGWLFIDADDTGYPLTTEMMNGIAINDLTTDYYYSARQRPDTGALKLIRQLNQPVLMNKSDERQGDDVVKPLITLNRQVLVISWWGETVKNATQRLKRLGVKVTWLDPSDINNDKIIHEMQKTQYDFELIVLRGAHHEIVTAAHRLRREGRCVKVANNPGVSAMVNFVNDALSAGDNGPVVD